MLGRRARGGAGAFGRSGEVVGRPGEPRDAQGEGGVVGAGPGDLPVEVLDPVRECVVGRVGRREPGGRCGPGLVGLGVPAFQRDELLGRRAAVGRGFEGCCQQVPQRGVFGGEGRQGGVPARLAAGCRRLLEEALQAVPDPALGVLGLRVAGFGLLLVGGRGLVGMRGGRVRMDG